MSDWKRCESCGEYDNFRKGYAFRHKCKPLWLVWESWCDDSDAMKVYAYDAKDAAQQAAEQMVIDQVEWQGEFKLLVKGANEDEPVLYEVVGEMVPEFSATKAKIVWSTKDDGEK